MPRANDGNELFKYLNTVYKFTPKSGGASTTVATTYASDAATIVLASGTGVAGGDFLYISGDGGKELVEVASLATATVTPVWPPYFGQTSGATVVEYERKSINHIAEGGVTFGGTQSSTKINAATSRVALATLTGAADFTFSIPMLALNGPNLQTAFGAPEVEIGAGTSGDAYRSGVNGTNVGTESDACYRLVGEDFGGNTIVLDILGAQAVINVSTTVGGTTPAGVTLSGSCNGYIISTYA